MQRSITTGIPAASARSAAARLITPSCIQIQRIDRPTAASTTSEQPPIGETRSRYRSDRHFARDAIACSPRTSFHWDSRERCDIPDAAESEKHRNSPAWDCWTAQLRRWFWRFAAIRVISASFIIRLALLSQCPNAAACENVPPRAFVSVRYAPGFKSPKSRKPILIRFSFLHQKSEMLEHDADLVLAPFHQPHFVPRIHGLFEAASNRQARSCGRASVCRARNCSSCSGVRVPFAFTR